MIFYIGLFLIFISFEILLISIDLKLDRLFKYFGIKNIDSKKHVKKGR